MSLNATRVLLVARPSFAEPVMGELRREAVAVEHATTLDPMRVGAFDIVVVEEGLADWRAAVALGVSVIVFADRADCDSITATLADGADDVISRGDRPHEAVARIRALARRRPRPALPNVTIRVGGVELDAESRRVSVRGEAIELTRRQFDLLEFFLRNSGRVHSRESLLEQVWDMAATQDVNAVEVQVRRLREAIGDDLREPKVLRAVRGVGYIYERSATS